MCKHPSISLCVCGLLTPLPPHTHTHTHTHAHTHSYILDNNICYLTLADKGYPRKLIFSYLEEIKDGFVQELTQDWGAEYVCVCVCVCVCV